MAIDVHGDLWRVPTDWRCITTNGFVKATGQAVMGRGCAQQARDKYEGIDYVLGALIRERGNHVHYLGKRDGIHLFSFPVKHRWMEPADLALIAQSCDEIAALWRKAKIARPIVTIPRPGCGNGQLTYEQVRPIIDQHLGEDEFGECFRIVTY